jgi:hypothetical protein
MPDILDSTGIEVFYVLEAAALVVGDGNLGMMGTPIGTGNVGYRFDYPESYTQSSFSEPVTVFCGPSFPDPRCAATFEQFEATADFDRYFGRSRESILPYYRCWFRRG